MPYSSRLADIYIHSVDVGFAVIDEQGVIRQVNDTMAGLLVDRQPDPMAGLSKDTLLPKNPEGKTLMEKLIHGEEDTLRITKVWWTNPESFIYLKGYAKYEEIEKYGKCRLLFLRDVSEEVLYRERMDFQASILQNVQDSVIVTDQQGLITYWNEGATQLFGPSGRDMLRQPITKLDVELELEQFLEEARKSPDYIEKREWVYLRSDSTTIYANTKLSPLIRNGEVSGLIAVSKDFTESKKLEQQLQRSQQELTSIVDSQTNYLIRTDLEGNYSYVNPAFLKKFSHYGDIIGMPYIPTIHPDDVEKAQKMAEECLSKPGKMVPIEIRKPAPEGGYYTNYWEFVAITDKDGNPTEIQGVGYDITEKKEREREIYRQQQELASIVDSQTNFLIRTDLEGNYSYANPAFLKKFSHYGDIIGKPYFPTIPPDDVEKAQKMAEECLSKPGKMVPIEIRKPAPEGGYHTNYWEFVAITDKDGNPTELQGVGYDITEKKRSEEQVKTLNQLNHLLLQISTDFINVGYQDLQQQIPDVLRSVTEFFGFDRSFIYLFNQDKSLRYLSYEYSVPGAPSFSQKERVYSTDSFPWWMGLILAGKTIQVQKLEDLPPEATKEYEVLKATGIKSIVAVPIVYQDDFLGYVGFSTLNEQKPWNEDIIELLQLLGAILSNALHRARTEQKLTTSNQQYRMLADNITDMVSRHNTQLRTLFVSPSCAELLGYEPRDLVGRDMKELLHHDDLLDAQEELNLSKESGKGRFQARMQKRNGVYTWVETYVSTVSAGDSLELILVTRDINIQKHIEYERYQLLEETQTQNEELNANEEELRQNLEYTQELNDKLAISERHFKGLIEKSFDAIVVYDSDGIIKYASPPALKITGYSNLIGKHGGSFVFDKDLPEAVQIIEKLMRNPGEHISFEQRIRRADGTIIWIEAVMTHQLEDEAIQGIISNFRDITEQKEATLALEESRTSLHIAQRVSKVGSWERDLVTGKISWSEEFYHIFGLDPTTHSPESMDAFQMIHPEDREVVRQRNDKVLRELKEVPISYRIIDAKGSLKFINALNKIIRDKRGRAIKMLGTVQDVTQQTKLEDLLDETSRIAQIGGWELDLNNNQLTWTREIYRIHEVPFGEEMSVERAFNYYHPDDVAGVQEAFRLLLEEGMSREQEVRIITAQNKQKWVRVSGEAYEEKDGKVSRVGGYMQDITEQKEREEKLRQYSERLALAVRTARIGIWEMDIATGKLHWNDQQLDIYGVSREHFEQNYDFWKTLIHPVDEVGADSELDKVMQGESVYDVEFRIIRPDGETRHINASAQPVFDQQGEIVRILGVNLDVSGIKRNEEEIRIYSRRLQLATASAQIGVWDLEVGSGKLTWDQRTHEQYGLSPEEFDGSFDSWRQRVHPDDIEAVQQNFNTALEKREDYEANFRIVRADNSEVRYIQAHATLVKEKATGQSNMIGVSWDVTEQKENEQRILQKNEDLEKANSELDHFVYSTSHNLRAPLTSIMGILQVLTEVDTEEEKQAFLGLISKSINKLDETIQEISDYSRNTRLGLQKEAVNFTELIGEVRESLSFMESADRIDYLFEIPEDLVFYSDTSRLRIIFNNLLSNAVKYSNARAEQSFIKLKISSHENGVRMVMEDNGIGIRQEHLDRIFDMFFRASNQASGSGLGLYIVKEAVAKLNGNISIDSTLGEGTRFDIYLPSL